MGFEHIDAAASGDEAAGMIAEAHYDIVLLDWSMPGKSGYALLQECRQDRKHDNTAFVMVTAESEERYVIEALKAGAVSYILKPVSSDVFQQKICNVIEWIERRLQPQK